MPIIILCTDPTLEYETREQFSQAPFQDKQSHFLQEEESQETSQVPSCEQQTKSLSQHEEYHHDGIQLVCPTTTHFLSYCVPSMYLFIIEIGRENG